MTTKIVETVSLNSESQNTLQSIFLEIYKNNHQWVILFSVYYHDWIEVWFSFFWFKKVFSISAVFSCFHSWWRTSQFLSSSRAPQTNLCYICFAASLVCPWRKVSFLPCGLAESHSCTAPQQQEEKQTSC